VLIELIVLDMSRDLKAVKRRLARIEHAITVEGNVMTEIDDRLTQLTDEVGGLADDVADELAQLAEALSGKLTDDQRAQFDSLQAKVADMKSSLEGDNPPAPEPAPGA